MLERIKGNIEANRKGFSLAEMLIVLLIISFLVLAMPPIVHKKVQKRITRGEHGRYECWVSPQDMTVDGVTYQKGKTYEYYATEKNGPCADCGAKNSPKGYIPTGGQCTFKPKEMAPNAAYFSFNVIGGGAGGSYAPYDPSDKMYKDLEATLSANVRLGKYVCTEGAPNIDGTCPPGSMGFVNGENPANWSWYGDIYQAGVGNCNDLDKHQFRNPINGDIGYINFWGRASETEHYAYNYKNSIEAYDELPRTKDWVKYYWVPVVLSNTSLQFCSGKGYTGAPVANSGSSAGSEYYKYFYGGPGGKGVCVRLKSAPLPVGVNYPSLGADNYFKVARAKRENLEYFFYVLNKDAKQTTKLVSMEKTRLTDDIDLPKAATNPGISNGGVEPSPGAITHQNLCGNSYEGNFVYLGGTGDNPDLLVLPGANGHEATSAVSTEISQQGDTVTIDGETINFTGANAANRIAGTVNAENSVWEIANDAPEGKFEASIPNLEGSTLFPSSILMTRKYGFDSTTFGYPGEPGESISMFLPNLTGNLTFEIGQGGEKGTAGHKTGGSGSNTYVKNSDGVNIFTAKGGVGHMGGEIGSKVLMFGEDILTGRGSGGPNPMKLSSVCESGVTFGAKTDKGGMPLLIDGCLDKGVRDNEKRFSADSGFYTILELDSETKTPSVINKLYGSIDDGGTGMLPGSGGDGGYSFLRDTSGEEHIRFTNHPNANNTDYDYPYTYTDGTGTKHQTITQKYKCYRKKENIGEASGKEVNNPATVCEPSIGYPGAVVIVW